MHISVTNAVFTHGPFWFRNGLFRPGEIEGDQEPVFTCVWREIEIAEF